MSKTTGLMHIYCGDGKGKSSTSIGLAVRANGSGLKVIFAQLMKSGKSGEVENLKKLGIDYRCPSETFGFYWNMTEEEKERAKVVFTDFFKEVMEEAAREHAEVLVFDEFNSCYNHGFIEHELALDMIKNRPSDLELIVTGRNPAPEICDLADYISEIKKVRHPFDKGINARKGIEY